MAKSKLISRIGALALAAALACTSLISASAATIDKATIDMDAKAQLSICMTLPTPKKMACGMRTATFLPASMTQK